MILLFYSVKMIKKKEIKMDAKAYRECKMRKQKMYDAKSQAQNETSLACSY